MSAAETAAAAVAAVVRSYDPVILWGLFVRRHIGCLSAVSPLPPSLHQVLSVEQQPGTGFLVSTQTTAAAAAADIRVTKCKWVLSAAGLFKGEVTTVIPSTIARFTVRSCSEHLLVPAAVSTAHVPDIPGLEENSISYNEMPTDRASYTNKTIGIIGAGNAGFETMTAVMEEAAYVHIHSRSQIKMAWETHYVGDLRSINMLPIDNYQLKSQDILHMPSPVFLTKEGAQPTTFTHLPLQHRKERHGFSEERQWKHKAKAVSNNQTEHAHGQGAVGIWYCGSRISHGGRAEALTITCFHTLLR